MPNLYITPDEIKDMAPDYIQSGTTKYDDSLFRAANTVSRWIDRYCNRFFYPTAGTRFLRGSGQRVMRIPDALSVSAIEYSEDDGDTYTSLAESGNWFLARSGGPDAWELDFHHPGSYDTLVMHPDPTDSDAPAGWPRDFRGVKITGVWAYTDDRDDAWEDTNDTVQVEQTAAATTLLVSDVEGDNLWGISPRIAIGHLLKVDDEYQETIAVSVNAGDDEVTVVRARNGTDAAVHTVGTTVFAWKTPMAIKQATAIQVVRTLERARAGYADSQANPDLGEIMWLRKIDPEVLSLLGPYRIKSIPA